MLSNKILKIFPYIIILVLSALLFSENDNSYIKEYEDRINSLNQKIDSLHTNNTGLKTEISNLEKQSDSLNIKIISAKEERIKIIKSYEYYLKDILELDDTELERWFSSRYPTNTTNTSSSTISSN